MRNTLILRNVVAIAICLAATTGAFAQAQTGTEQDPYIITTAAELDNVRSDLTAHYKLGADIDLADYLSPSGAGYNGGVGWVPIGDLTTPFTGTFDGDGHVIRNLKIRATTGSYYAGLFGCVTGTNNNITENNTIKNLGLEDVDIESTASQSGAIVGGRLTQAKITGCYATGEIRAMAIVGGLVSQMQGYTMIENCWSGVDVYVTGAAANNNNAGGIAAYVSGSNGVVIRFCYATGAVVGNGLDGNGTGNDGLGGIIGYSAGTASGGVTLTYNVAMNSQISGITNGAIIATQTRMGRIWGRCGTNRPSCYNYADSTILGAGANPPWQDNLSSMLLSRRGEDKTTVELQTATFYTTQANWNNGGAVKGPWDNNIWALVDGSYPMLKAFVSANDISGKTISLEYATTVYNGAQQRPTVTVTDDAATLIENTDYTLSFSNSINAGTVTITINGIGAYSGSITRTYTITPKTLIWIQGAVEEKVYDGTTAATVATEPQLNGVCAGDNVTVSTGTAAFLNIFVGTKQVNAIDYGITGAHAANYQITGTTGASGRPFANGTITPKPITITGVTAADREYEAGNTSVVLSGGTLEGVISADESYVGFTLGNGTMADADAGNGKTVTTNIILTGSYAYNYLLTQPAVAVNIIKVPQTAPAAPTMASKTFNSITLNTISGAEYRIDSGAWQSSTLFDNLTPATQYEFEARMAETTNYSASPISPAVQIITDVAPTLISIATPTAITGLPNGTAKTAVALGLPESVMLVTNEGNASATVNWNVAGCSYNPALTTAQNFTVSGTVVLPSSVVNPNSVPLTVTINVSVNAAAPPPAPDTVLQSIVQPAAITGLPNGTTKTAVALGLPETVTLVTNEGNFPATVNWNVAGCSYNPALTTAQNFNVSGTAVLPSSVKNPNSVPLSITISVSVKAATSTGINDLLFADLLIYPNPCTSAVSVKNAEGAELKIVDMKGQVVGYCKAISASQEISVANLSSGVYLLQLTQNGQTKVVKLVKK